MEKPSGQSHANRIEIPKDYVIKHTREKGLLDVGTALSIMSGKPMTKGVHGGLMLLDSLLGN